MRNNQNLSACLDVQGRKNVANKPNCRHRQHVQADDKQTCTLQKDPAKRLDHSNSQVSVVVMNHRPNVYIRIPQMGNQHQHPRCLIGYVCNSVMDMYGELGRSEDARKVFVEIGERDLVSYNVLISVYVKCKRFEDAVEVYVRTRDDGIRADEATVVSTLYALMCGLPVLFFTKASLFKKEEASKQKGTKSRERSVKPV
nr:pentatricopeptide repeat-containing protein At1g31430 [Tanacetum cinerariifolium]